MKYATTWDPKLVCLEVKWQTKHGLTCNEAMGTECWAAGVYPAWKEVNAKSRQQVFGPHHNIQQLFCVSVMNLVSQRVLRTWTLIELTTLSVASCCCNADERIGSRYLALGRSEWVVPASKHLACSLFELLWLLLTILKNSFMWNMHSTESFFIWLIWAYLQFLAANRVSC